MIKECRKAEKEATISWENWKNDLSLKDKKIIWYNNCIIGIITLIAATPRF